MDRRYYSLRTGKNPKGAEIDLLALKKLFRSSFSQWEEAGYFQEYFGYSCVDAGDVPGKLGQDVDAEILFQLRKETLWPVHARIDDYTEDDLFDVIEFLHDHISKPLEGYYHSYSDCGHHYNTFDGASGRKIYRARINQLLNSYKSGFEMSDIGEIIECAQPGTNPLLAADIPTDDKNISSRVEAAISKFRRYRSTLAERRDAIRDLADVLEYIRPQIKNVLTKADESDLFNLANNFGIRHHNQQQKTDYDHAVWLSWMFYFYLSTIHACLHMLNRNGHKKSSI